MWLRLLEPIDNLIDGITMYRLLLYYLLGLLALAMGLSAAGDLHYSILDIAISATTLTVACWLINKVLAFIFDAPVNPESSLLTALILALIITPSRSSLNILFLIAASGLAMASKYIFTIRNKHLFNPAAIAVVLTALGPKQNASWWVGTAVLLPIVLTGGLLVIRKVRREHMLISFLITTTLVTALYAVLGKNNLAASMQNMLLSSPIFFLGFVMLCEPYTSPPTRIKQIYYGTLVGILAAPQVHILNFYTSPEIALIIGNLFAYVISPKAKLFPILRQKLQIASDTLEFTFLPNRKLAYQPGQYMEWTLPHHNMDSRGARRFFTLASSPTEKYLKLGVKFYKNGSSYKSAMLDMDQNTPVVAGQIAGDFILPKDANKKLVFIAGGIGITPFRSMVKYLLDTKDTRDISLFYSARAEEDFAYKDVLESARNKIGLRSTYVVTNSGASLPQPFTIQGIINGSYIKQTVPDYMDRLFYISGTHAMVENLQEQLAGLGVPSVHIKTDFFSGYA